MSTRRTHLHIYTHVVGLGIIASIADNSRPGNLDVASGRSEFVDSSYGRFRLKRDILNVRFLSTPLRAKITEIAESVDGLKEFRRHRSDRANWVSFDLGTKYIL